MFTDFTETDFQYYCNVQHRLPQAGKDYLTGCFFGNGSRLVGTHAKGNIVSWVPSPKSNGKTFSTESRGPERALNTIMQFNKAILWYGDQAEPVDIIRTNKNGRKQRGGYTADGIALSTHGPIAYEAKTESKIEELLMENPTDWQRLESGSVVYRPALEAFDKFGLDHKVFVYSVEQQFYVSNLNHIWWVRENADVGLPDVKQLNRIMRENFSLTLAELRLKLKLESIAPLVKAVDEGLIVVDLKGQLMADTESCLVSTSVPLLEQAFEFRRNQLIYRDGLIEPKSITLVPTLKSADDALKRLSAVQNGLSNRNVRRWKAQIKSGETAGKSAFQSLISKYHLCGQYRKINSKVENCLMEYLLNRFIGESGISIYRGYCQYRVSALEVHPEFKPVTRKTFTRRFESIPPEIVGYARGGKRMGNAKALPTDPKTRNLKAMTAWECVAIDHYCVDIYLVVYIKTGELIVERPWLTLMIDLYTGKVIAFSISFKKPSRHSVAKVIRACVRMHGKLPREIIVDRGAEFKSVYMASLLAHYQVILSLRPASDPRYGGEVEGFFGEFKKQWLCQREGNLANYKEARSVDGSKTPKKAAVLTPSDFFRELKQYCLWRENACRGVGPESSDSKFVRSQRDFPYVSIAVNYDAVFVVSSCVEAKKYTVDLQHGINIEGTWFSSPAMSLLVGKPKENDVRPDPENPNLIFVKVEDRWEPFYSSQINAYGAKTEEQQIAEGMIKFEAANLKRKIKEKDDEGLARLVNEMDQFRSEFGETPVLEIDVTNSTRNQTKIFAKLKNANIRPINVQGWRT